MEAEKFYHIYNHANGRENLFSSEENYYFFLRQWTKYIEPIAKTFAYCLMPNHIHFLIQLKSEQEVSLNLGFNECLPFGKFKTFQMLISKQFSNLFSSYTQAYNKRYERKGSLFIPNFKRKEITTEEYLKILVCYIHRNPIHHGFCSNFDDWKYSSYHAYLSDKNTKIERDYMLEQFSDKANFVAIHQQQVEQLNTNYFLD